MTSLRQRQKSALERRDRHRWPGVGVDHAGRLRPRLVDRAVDHIASLVDPIAQRTEIRRWQDVAGGWQACRSARTGAACTTPSRWRATTWVHSPPLRRSRVGYTRHPGAHDRRHSRYRAARPVARATPGTTCHAIPRGDGSTGTASADRIPAPGERCAAPCFARVCRAAGRSAAVVALPCIDCRGASARSRCVWLPDQFLKISRL